jgi:hypothetical protein
VEPVDDGDQGCCRPRDGEEEPGLLGDGLAIGPALELLDHPVQTIRLDACSGVAASDLAVEAADSEKWEELIGEIVGPDLGGGPPDGGREHHRGAEAEQLGKPAAVEDVSDGVPASAPERLVVRCVVTGIDPAETRVVTEQVGVQVDERRRREAGGHGLDSTDGIAGHRPRSVRELPMLRGEGDESPPDLHLLKPRLVSPSGYPAGEQRG